MALHHCSPRRLIGKRIEALARVLYEYEGHIEGDEGALELVLDGETFLFEADADGEGLRLREQAWMDPFEEPLSDENRAYVEEYGRWCRVDCSRTKPYVDLCGQKITDACALLNEFGKVGGVRISVSTRSMWFAVQADESYVYWTPPTGFSESRS